MRKKVLKCISLATVLVLSVSVLAGCGGDKSYDYDLDDYVKVGNYKDLTYSKVKVSVSDAEVQQEINNRLENAKTTEEVKKGTVKKGDTINVSYEGKIDGKSFNGGSSDSYDIVVGQTSMIDGFVEGLIGKKIGETVTLNLKFPDDYQNEDVAGKDVVFTVTIKSKKVETTPKYNLDFVKKNSDCKTLEEYEKSVKEDLLKDKKEQAKKYPEEELNAIKTTTKDNLKQQIESSGATFEDYLKQQNTDEKTINKQIKEYAQNRVLNEMVIYSIARAEDLEVTDKEYKDYMDDMLESSGIDEKTFKSTYGMTVEEYCENEGLRPALLYNKVMEKIYDDYSKAK